MTRGSNHISAKQAGNHKADALLTTQACTIARLLARQAAAELRARVGDPEEERDDNDSPEK